MASNPRIPRSSARANGVPSFEALLAQARRLAAKIGVEVAAEDAAASVQLKLLERQAAGQPCSEQLASKMLRDAVADAGRLRRRDLGGSARAPHRPPDERYRDPVSLRAAVLEHAGVEFGETWGVPSGQVLPGALSGIVDVPAAERRSWLVFTLDHALGDHCPWAVDPSFRRRGAARRRAPRGVGAPPPDPPHPLQRARADFRRGHGREMGAVELLAFAGSDHYDRACTAYSALRRPGANEFLTDREIAIVSLLLGQWPAALDHRTTARGRLAAPARWGEVLTLEVEAIQSARRRHGVLNTTEKKRLANLAPKSRR